MLPWLIEHRSALHDLLAYLPYPEVAVKRISARHLVHWGELEAYDVQVGELRKVIDNEATPTKVKVYCRSWLAACTASSGHLRDRTIARDSKRWHRLGGMYTDAPSCARPLDISEECWSILHTLPYAAWAWPKTPWGSTPCSHFGSIYHAHPAIRQLCENVAERSNWGGIVAFPSGLTWEDRLVSMETGMSASSRC